MKRISDVDLTDRSAKYGGEWLESSFKSAKEPEKSLILNTVSHGWFMGARHCEFISNAPKWKFWLRRNHTEEQLITEGIKAAGFYVEARGYRQSFESYQLIKACLSMSFREGFKWRQEQSY